MADLTSITGGAVTPVEARWAKARGQAEQFEGFFVYQMMELMKTDDGEDNVMDGGEGEEMFRHTLNEKIGDGVARGGGFGLADQIMRQLVQHGDVQAPANPQRAAQALAAYRASTTGGQ